MWSSISESASNRFGFGPESGCAVCVSELIKGRDGKNIINLPHYLFVKSEIVIKDGKSSPAVFLVFSPLSLYLLSFPPSCLSILCVTFKSQEGRAANESVGISCSDDGGWESRLTACRH